MATNNRVIRVEFSNADHPEVGWKRDFNSKQATNLPKVGFLISQALKNEEPFSASVTFGVVTYNIEISEPKPEKTEFLVQVTRETYTTKAFKVLAADLLEAEDIAIDAAHNYEYDEGDVEYKVNNCFKFKEGVTVDHDLTKK